MVFKILFVFLIVYFLIFIHEFGHYFAAKRNGVKVEEFSIGFPPRLISFKNGDTKFSFALLPLGGYVKLHGDTLDENGGSKITKSKSFVYKTPWQKIKILLAGVFMNFLVYLVLMTAAFSFGVPKLIQSYDQFIAEVNSESIQIEPGLKIESIVDGSKASEGYNLDSQIEFIDGSYLLNESVSFENLSDLNEFGIELHNVVELPVLRVLTQSDNFSKNDLLLAVDGKKFKSYSDFLSLINDPKIDKNVSLFAGESIRKIQLTSVESEFMVLNVFDDSSAKQAGVKEGFKLIEIDGTKIDDIDNFSEFVKNLNKDEILYSFKDLNEKIVNLIISPDSEGVTGMVLNPIYESIDLNSKFVLDTLKYSVLDLGEVKMPFHLALITSFENGISMSWNIMKSFVETVFNFFTRFEVSKEVGGPVAVFKMSYDYVTIGGTQLMQFVALISLTLAAINILPIPVLDGGRILIVFIEALLNKQASRKVLNLVTLASFGILMFFILIVTFFDIIRL